MDDDVGLAMIEKARKLDVRNIAIHKGLPFGRESYEHSPEQVEGPYDPKRSDGIDALCTSLAANGIKPGANVYAELGSTWRFLMRNPDSAAHALGKLLRYCGEDNVLWGTDSIWYGSPQDQIQAFRTFQISPALRDKHGYPEITREVRAKVFGLNALRIYPVPDDVLEKHLRKDRVSVARAEYRDDPDPSFATYGPRTRREFLNLKAWGG
jgi:hypothetical protein